MNGLRHAWLVSRGLRYLCLVIFITITVAGCPSPSPPPPSPPPPSSSVPASPSAPSGIPTDTASKAVALQSGKGPGGGETGVSVPVEAIAYGSATTVPFMVDVTPVNVSYSYSCPAGYAGFQAEMTSGSPTNPGSDDEPIANDPDSSGATTVSVSLQDVPGDYYIQVSSPCDWEMLVAYG
jgi:hypothetical protein